MARAMIDLQAHSTVSDGQLAPSAVADLLQRADEALYAAKGAGKGRAVRAGKAA